MAEEKILKTFLIASLFGHAFAAWSPYLPLWRSKPSKQEVIEVDLVNWTPPAQAKPPKVDKKKMLPQLPKSFKVKESVAKKDSSTMKLKKDQKKKKEEKRKMEAIKKRALTELSQKDYIRRLQLEQARKATEHAETAQAWGQYQSQLKRWIRTNYTIPEVYKNNNGIKTTVELVLDPQGRILTIKVHQHSGDKTFDQIVLANLRKSSPFPTPPKRLVGEPLQFEYSAND
ncbi:MAG: TonB family protein [Oligoflexales bacterium]